MGGKAVTPKPNQRPQVVDSGHHCNYSQVPLLLLQWYGSLEASQPVTEAGVEAAILGAYAGHQDNPFVAAARFIDEVRQAINFAAELLSFDWRGPRLRLHQAHASAQMTRVLKRLVA